MEALPTYSPETISLLFFYLILMSFIIFSIILHYHWQNYSMDSTVTKKTYLVFFLTSLPLLALMGIAVLIM